MFKKEINIKNKTLRAAFFKDQNSKQIRYALQLFTIKKAQYIGQDTTETFFTIGLLIYGKRIKIITHKRTHIKQRIA